MRVNGFTLIELLAAMVAGSILLIALGWVTGSLGREVRPSDEEREALRVARAGLTIERLIGTALGQDKSGAKLDISPMELRTLVAPPAALGPVGPLDLRLTVTKENKGDALYATFQPAKPENDLPSAILAPVKLAENFRSIRLSPEGSAGNAVRIIFEGAGNRSVLAMTHVSSSGACRYDAISATCR